MLKKKKFWIPASIILFLVALNFALEPLALHYANKALGGLKGYKGSIQDIEIHLYRGAYRIDSLQIQKVENGNTTPFFAVSAIDISVEWKSLFKGAFVSEFSFEHPVINFIKKGKEVETGGGNDFVATVKALSPITINRVELIDGEVHYIDRTSSPKIDVSAKEISAYATNLRNVEDSKEKLPSNLSLRAKTSGNGTLTAKMTMNALKETPDFDFNLELKAMNLAYLKDFTDAYADFTFKKGQLDLSSELAMEDGEYKGYIKPVLDHIKIIDWKGEYPETKKKSFFKKIWEGIVGTGVAIVENKPKERLATKVPLKGNIKEGETFTWTTIVNVLRNGFVKAFDADVEGSINIDAAKTPVTRKDKK